MTGFLCWTIKSEHDCFKHMTSLKMSYDIVRYDTVNLQEPFNFPVILKVDQNFLAFYLDIISQSSDRAVEVS